MVVVVVVFCFDGFGLGFGAYDLPYPDEVTLEYLFRRFELVDLSCDLSDALSADAASLLTFLSYFCNLGFGLREVVLATALVLFPGMGFLPNNRDLPVTLLSFSLGLLSFSFRRALLCCKFVLIVCRNKKKKNELKELDRNQPVIDKICFTHLEIMNFFIILLWITLSSAVI